MPSRIKKRKRDTVIANKLSYVSKIDRGDLPTNPTNEADARRRQRLSQRSLTSANKGINVSGGKKTKRIMYHKNTKKTINKTTNKKTNKKTKKGIYNKKHNFTKKLIKKQKLKKTRKT